MRKEKMAIILFFVMVALLFVVPFLIYLNMHPSEPVMKQDESLPTASEGEPSSKLMEKVTEGKQFEMSSSFPQILIEDEYVQIYIENQKLMVQQNGRKPQQLFEWTEGTIGRYWHNNGNLLIAAENSDKVTGWISIFLNENGEWEAKPVDLKIASDQLITVRTTDGNSEIQLFYLAYRDGERVGEAFYDPVLNHTRYVNDDYYYKKLGGRKDFALLDTNRKSLHLTALFNPPDNSYLIEDELGAIYYKRNWATPQRYFSDHKIEYKSARDLSGNPLYLFRIKAGDREIMLFEPTDGQVYNGPIEYYERLWSGEINVLDHVSFFQFASDQIRFFYYSFQDDRTILSFQAERIIPLQNAAYLGRTGQIAEFAKDGKFLKLSLFDLAYEESPRQGSSRLDELEIIAPLVGVSVKADDTEAQLPQYIEANFPWKKEAERYNTNAEIPQSLLDWLRSNDFETGDYGPNDLYRKIDGIWYFLRDQQLYRYKDDQLEKLGEIPATMSYSFSIEGTMGFGPQDIQRTKEGWVVADTFGNRVILLNENLQLEKEIKIELPAKIEVLSDGRYRVEGLQGYTLLDQSFNLVKEEKKPFVGIMELPDYELRTVQLRPEQLYIDQDKGLEWYYMNEGGGSKYLHIYRKKDQTIKSFLVGNVERFEGEAKIIPWKEKVILLFDNRLQIFRKNGEWEGQINFPRPEIIGRYYFVGSGENSYYFDEKDGKIYLVQGGQLTMIDLVAKKSEVLFNQPSWRLGNLLFSNGLFYISARVGEPEEYLLNPEISTSITLLLVYDLRHHELTRYLLNENYETYRWDEGGKAIILRKVHPNHSDLHLYQKISLNEIFRE